MLFANVLGQDVNNGKKRKPRIEPVSKTPGSESKTVGKKNKRTKTNLTGKNGNLHHKSTQNDSLAISCGAVTNQLRGRIKLFVEKSHYAYSGSYSGLVPHQIQTGLSNIVLH